MKTAGITFGVLFYLKKQKTSTQGKAPICARVTVNGKRTEISIKRSVNANEWDERKGMAKGSRKETIELNMFLNQFKAKIINTYQQMVLTDVPIDGPAIRDKILGTNHLAPTLVSLMEYHNEQQLHKLAPGTMKNYHTTQRYVKKFLMEKLYRDDVVLSQLTYKFILDFERYLFNYVPKDHQKPLNNNGIMKHIERLRKMINMAVKLDWLTKDPFASFKKHFDKVERESLNGNYRLWALEYTHQYSTYRELRIPQEIYSMEGVYSFYLFGDIRKNISLNAAITGLIGYETINRGNDILVEMTSYMMVRRF